MKWLYQLYEHCLDFLYWKDDGSSELALFSDKVHFMMGKGLSIFEVQSIFNIYSNIVSHENRDQMERTFGTYRTSGESYPFFPGDAISFSLIETKDGRLFIFGSRVDTNYNLQLGLFSEVQNIPNWIIRKIPYFENGKYIPFPMRLYPK